MLGVPPGWEITPFPKSLGEVVQQKGKKNNKKKQPTKIKTESATPESSS